MHESRVFLNSAMFHMCETLIFYHGFLDYYSLQPKVVSNVWEKIKYTMVNWWFGLVVWDSKGTLFVRMLFIRESQESKAPGPKPPIYH